MSPWRGKRLIIFGCGYIGSALARRARTYGLAVTTLTRNPTVAASLEAQGFSTLLADLASDDWHGHLAGEFDAVVVCVGAGGPGVDGYRRSYVEGIRSVLRWVASTSRPPEFGLFTSSTSVYPQRDGERVDEQADTSASTGTARVLLEAEELWRRSPFARRVVLRLAGIYGPGRHQLLDQLRSGAVEMRGGRQRLNLAHRDDIVGAITACLENSSLMGDSVLNVADGTPSPREDVISWLAQHLGRSAPVFTPPTRRDGEPVRDRIIVSDRLRAATGWRPIRADFRAGYEAIREDA
ncbi:MAG TPA: NAD-dependent epimerase/dehydratase family protein [Candidatus Didemnitutus sp.]|nr:NAD-dependent epimerase/dehydratase family protein [Candidatus Didemnitutus sp.]